MRKTRSAFLCIRKAVCVMAVCVMFLCCAAVPAAAENTGLALEGYIRGAFTIENLFSAAESALEDGMEAKQVVQEMIALADSEDALEFLNRAMDNCAAAGSEESKKILAMLEADEEHRHFETSFDNTYERSRDLQFGIHDVPEASDALKAAFDTKNAHQSFEPIVWTEKDFSTVFGKTLAQFKPANPRPAYACIVIKNDTQGEPTKAWNQSDPDGEDSNVGVNGIIPNLVYAYADSGNPWSYIEYVDALGKMDEWNQQGLYAKTISDWLLNDPVTTLVTTYSQPGLKETNDAAEIERLAAVKAAMTEDEIKAIVEQSSAFEDEDDSSQYVAQLQAVTVESLPEEVIEYDVYDETDEAGVRHIDAVAGVEGIGAANIFLDASGLPQEDIHWFKLYTDLLGDLDTAWHTRSELAELISRYLYDGEIRLSLLGAGDEYHPCLGMTWTATDDDLDEGYDLMRELMYDSKVEDTDRVKETVTTLKNGLKSSITSNPYSVQLYRALGVTSELYRYYSYINHIEYYEFLTQVEGALETAPEAVAAKLQGIQDYFNNSANAVALFAGNEESIALNRALADEFLSHLDKREIEAVEYDLPAAASSEALVIDSAVQFNGIAADFASVGLEGFEGGLDALTALVSDTFLYPLLRDQYGAYGVIHGALTDAGMYLISYRDPNVAETFDVYSQLHELVSDLHVDQETLDGYILSAYSSYAMPEGALSGALSAAISVLDPAGTVDAVEIMQALKAMTPEKIQEYAGIYEKLMENGVLFTAGAASAIEANADLYEVVLNPFNAQDPTQVEFVDATEEHAQYDAVRFAFENGLMAPKGEDTFGVDDPATAGDLYTALYVLVGGDLSPEDAVAFFAGYGLADADTDIDAEISDADAVSVMSGLAQLMGLEWADEAAEEPITRGDLAVRLDQYLADLNG